MFSVLCAHILDGKRRKPAPKSILTNRLRRDVMRKACMSDFLRPAQRSLVSAHYGKEIRCSTLRMTPGAYVTRALGK